MTGAEEMTIRLGGRWRGSYGTARCPAHDDHSPSLTLRDGDRTTLLSCKTGCEIRDILAALRHGGIASEPREIDPVASARAAEKRRRAAQRALVWCRELWSRATGIRGTPVEVFFASRGLDLPNSRSLRYSPACPHPSGIVLPAMLSRIDDVDGKAIGLQRTYLHPDGRGKADIDPDRAMLGLAAGGAVRLSPGSPELVVGEGIETVLAVMQATGMPGWAALTTSGLLRLVLPAEITSVLICADNDPSGERAARSAAARWVAEGRRVRIALPPAAGSDFNDLLINANAGERHAA